MDFEKYGLDPKTCDTLFRQVIMEMKADTKVRSVIEANSKESAMEFLSGEVQKRLISRIFRNIELCEMALENAELRQAIVLNDY